ncbi:MAG: HEAT repeat domain-containing protein [bacterium]
MRWLALVSTACVLIVFGLVASLGPPDLLGWTHAGAAWVAGGARQAYEAVKDFDPSKGPLAIIAAIATIAAGLAPAVKYFWRYARKAETPSPLAPSDAKSSAAAEAFPLGADPSQLLPVRESIAAYLDQIEAHLKESAAREHFVALKAEDRGTPLPSLIQKFEHREATQARPVDLLQAHKQFEQYVLLGPPGSGKSTCLKRLTLDLIQAYRKDPEHEIPIFSSLAHWADKRLSALDFLRHAVLRLTGPRNRLASELDDYLARGELVVVLDGLNEMPSRSRGQRRNEEGPLRGDRNSLAEGLVAGKLLGMRVDPREQSVRELALSRGVRSRFVLSCRSHEFSGSFDWKRVHVLPMDGDQIDTFLRLHLPNGHERLAKILAQNRALFELARNPFYLRLLTVLFEQDLTRISTRGQFLKLLLDTLLDREQRQRGEPLEIARFERNLGTLAFRMIARDMIGSQVDLRTVGHLDEDVATLGVDTGLLTQTSDGAIVFYHQLVQEFFAALALQRRYEGPSLKRLLRAEKWLETLVLYGDIADGAERIDRRLRRLLKQRNGLTLHPSRSPGPGVLFVAVTVVFGFFTANLFVDWIAGGGWFLSLVSAAPLVTLAFCVGVPVALLFVIPAFCYHRAGISNAGYVLSQMRTAEVQRESIPAIVDAFSRVGMSRKKLVDALVEVGEPAVEWLLLGLQSRKPNVRRGCIEALGRLRAPQALEPLITIVQDGDPQFFIQAAEALGQLDDPRGRVAIAQSLDVIESGLRIGAGLKTWMTVFAKTNRRDEEFSARLAARTGRDQPGLRRVLAIAGLGAYGHASALPTLAAIGRDGEDPLRAGALKSLARLETPDVVAALLDIAELEGGPKGSAVVALGSVTSTSTRDALIPLLDHRSWWIRDAALESLGRMRDPAAVPAILERLVELRKFFGEEVVDALERIGSPDAFDGLATLAKDPRKLVRERALFALDRLFPDRAGSLFVKFLHDPMYPDRSAVLQLLVDAPPPGEEFQRTLTDLQRDRDTRLAHAALVARNRLDRGLEQRLKQIGVSLGGSRVYGMARRLVDWTGWPKYKRLLHEFELMSESNFEASAKIVELAQRDPEVERRLRPMIRIMVLLFILGLALVGALPVLLWRPLSGLGWLAIQYWPWAAGLAAVAVATYMPGFRWLGKIRWVGAMLRVSLIVLLLALLIRYGPSALLTGAGWLRDAILWAGAQIWAYKAWSGGLVVVAVLLVLARNRVPQRLRVLRGSVILCGGLALATSLASLAILYWQVTLGLILLAVVVAVPVSRRVARERPFLIAEDTSTSFAEFDVRTERMAAGLLGLGLAPGDRALFQMGTATETAVALVGCFKAGIVPVCTLPQSSNRLPTDVRPGCVRAQDGRRAAVATAAHRRARERSERGIAGSTDQIGGASPFRRPMRRSGFPGRSAFPRSFPACTAISGAGPCSPCRAQ